MARRTPRTWKPEVVGLESRAVPTVVSPLAFGGQGTRALLQMARGDARLAAAAQPAATNSNGQSSVSGGTPGSINFTPNATIAPSETTPGGTALTPVGLARARFTARASGPFALGRSSFQGVSRDITYIGNFGSNQILHGTMVMRITVPSDPTLPTTGVVSLRDRSIATTGTQIVLDLTITATDTLGRPTAATWLIDATSGSAYATAIGQGSLTIAYHKNGHSKDSAGGAVTTFHGQILPTGLGSNINYDLPKFN